MWSLIPLIRSDSVLGETKKTFAEVIKYLSRRQVVDWFINVRETSEDNPKSGDMNLRDYLNERKVWSYFILR